MTTPNKLENIQFSKNFTLFEAIDSAKAKELGIENIPNQEQIDNIGRLVRVTLQPLRDMVDVPVKIHSLFRCVDLNTAVGGVATSDHCKGLAADISFVGLDLRKAYLQIMNQKQFSFGQLIYEDSDLTRYGEEWIHISYGIKRMCLVAEKFSGRMQYFPYEMKKAKFNV